MVKFVGFPQNSIFVRKPMVPVEEEIEGQKGYGNRINLRERAAMFRDRQIDERAAKYCHRMADDHNNRPSDSDFRSHRRNDKAVVVSNLFPGKLLWRQNHDFYGCDYREAHEYRDEISVV